MSLVSFVYPLLSIRSMVTRPCTVDITRNRERYDVYVCHGRSTTISPTTLVVVCVAEEETMNWFMEGCRGRPWKT